MVGIMNPPWLEILLKTIRTESILPSISWIRDVCGPADIAHIEKSVSSSDFDTLGLQRALWDAVKAGSASLVKWTCPFGSIFIVYETAYPWKFPFALIGRVLRLFYNPSTPFRVIFFGSRTERVAPPAGQTIKREHINGGYTYPCDPGTIVVYRREEVERVLIHECLHASCSDPRGVHLPVLEADTEAWAEIVLCALLAGGVKRRFVTAFSKQMVYASKQADALALHHRLRGPDDYAWRYTAGKLGVWTRLGFVIPQYTVSRTPIMRLRLTVDLQ
jgi:hypothetical protein